MKKVPGEKEPEKQGEPQLPLAFFDLYVTRITNAMKFREFPAPASIAPRISVFAGEPVRPTFLVPLCLPDGKELSALRLFYEVLSPGNLV